MPPQIPESDSPRFILKIRDLTVPSVHSERARYSLTAIILIQAEGKHLLEVENEIAKISEVISAYDVTGDFDIAVVAKFKDRTNLNAFIKTS